MPCPDLSTYRALTDDEAFNALRTAIFLQSRHMPVLNGKGKLVDREEREIAIKVFAQYVFDQLYLANNVIVRGRPSEMHSTPS